MPQVIDLRLRILTCLCKWEQGGDLASVLRFAVDEDEEPDETEHGGIVGGTG